MVRLAGKSGAVGHGTSLVGMTANIAAPDIVVGPTAVYVVALTAEPNQPARDVVYRLEPNTLHVTARETLPTVGVAVLAYGQGPLFATGRANHGEGCFGISWMDYTGTASGTGPKPEPQRDRHGPRSGPCGFHLGNHAGFTLALV